MVSGPALKRFEGNLATTSSNVREVEDEVAGVRAKVREARAALETPGRIERDADHVGDKLDRMQLTLEVTEKVPALKPLSFALEKTLQSAEDVADDVEAKARDVRKRIEQTGWIDELKRTEERLASIERDLADKAGTVDDYEQTTGRFIEGFDRVGRPAAPLADATDRAVTPPNDAVEGINAQYDAVKADFFELTDLIDRADFSPVIDVGNDFERVVDVICDLDDFLSIAYSALKPIEPVLDAAGLVFELTVEPVLDWLLDKIGLDQVMETLNDEIERLLPDFDPLDTLEAKIDGVFDEIERFLNTNFDVDDWIGDIQARLLDPVTDAASGPTGYGTAGADTLEGDGGRDIIDPRAGDDVVYGRGGDDILVGSAGDDVLRGGRGRDIALFSGSFAQYTFSQTDDDGPFVVVHTAPRRGTLGDGVETLYSVAELRFTDLTTTTRELREQVQVAEGATLDGTMERDFLYAGPSAVTIRGRGEDDWITGSNGADTLRGGYGDDTFNTKGGADEVFGGPGRDTWLFPSDGSGGGLVDADLGDGIAWDGADRDTLNSIENVVVQDPRDATVTGDGGRNLLQGANGGDDLLDGRGGRDRIVGGDGDNVLIGGAGVDEVVGGADRDEIVAGGPVVRGRGERYDGGDGFDELIYAADLDDYIDLRDPRDLEPQPASTAVRIFAGAGTIARLDAAGEEVLARDTARNIESFVGSDLDDILHGRLAGDDGFGIRIDGADGDDRLISKGARFVRGGPGDDTLIAVIKGDDLQSTNFDGGMGVDTLDLTRGDLRWSLRLEGALGTRIEAFRTNDRQALGAESENSDEDRPTRLLVGNVDEVEVVELAGADDEVWMGGDEKMTVFGGAGDDRLLRDVATDGTGEAVLYGGGGADVLRLEELGRLYGNTGADELEVATFARDVVARGGKGDDFVLLKRGVGVFRGDGGYDTLTLDPSSGQDTTTVDLGARSIVAVGSSGRIEGEIGGFEQVIGADDGIADRIVGRGNAGERLFGRSGDDVLEGRGRPDELYGGTGNDRLVGGGGDDLLHGAGGDDVLEGGRGRDTASYANAVPGGPRAETTADETPFGSVSVDLATGRAAGAAGDDRLSGIENVRGSEGADTLVGDAGDNALHGAGGDDRLVGGDGDDVLVPGAGDDVVVGGPGRDRIVLDVGNHDIDGGDGGGWDRLDLGTLRGRVTIDFADGSYDARLRVETAVWRDTGTREARSYEGEAYTPTDVLETAPAFADSADDLTRSLPPEPADDDPDARATYERFKIETETVRADGAGTFTGIEKILGGRAATRLLPSLERDIFDGRGENSTRDRLDLSAADVGVRFDIAAGEGDHALVAGDRFKGLDRVSGSAFGDRIYGDDGAERLVGGSGNDRLVGRAGDDQLVGNKGRDLLKGWAGDDFLNGGRWGDELRGGAGNDELHGRKGHDVLYGHKGRDVLKGGSGNDELNGGGWIDRLYGGNGHDVVNGQGGHDRIQGGPGRDVLRGGDGNDKIKGGGWADRLIGGAGNDRLKGQGGPDVLKGFKGADRLVGGWGDDTLTGNAGGDRFVFREDHGNDRITDLGGRDHLLLDADLWRGELNARQVVDRFGSDTRDGYRLAFEGGETIDLDGATRSLLIDSIEIA